MCKNKRATARRGEWRSVPDSDLFFVPYLSRSPTVEVLFARGDSMREGGFAGEEAGEGADAVAAFANVPVAFFSFSATEVESVRPRCTIASIAPGVGVVEEALEPDAGCAPLADVADEALLLLLCEELFCFHWLVKLSKLLFTSPPWSASCALTFRRCCLYNLTDADSYSPVLGSLPCSCAICVRSARTKFKLKRNAMNSSHCCPKLTRQGIATNQRTRGMCVSPPRYFCVLPYASRGTRSIRTDTKIRGDSGVKT